MPEFRHIPFQLAERTAEERLSCSREFLQTMLTRRTVRHFSPNPPEFELIENAVRVAASAPSGANQQPWRFVVVSDPETKRAIRMAAEQEERTNYEQRFPDDWLEALAPLGTDWHKEFLETAPFLIVVFRIDYGFRPDGSTIKHYYVSESVGIACGFLLAALHRSGLAALTHTPSPMGFLSQILDRPVNERPYLLIPVGFAAEDATVPDISRKTFDEVMLLR